MNITKYLEYAGKTVIAGGIIFALYGLINLDFKSYSAAKELAEGLSDYEEVANATLAAARTVWLSQLSFVLGSLFAGIVGGLVLLGFSTHLELQERIKSHTEQTKYYTQLTKETVEKYIKSQEKL